MIMVSIALVMAVIVTNIFMRKDTDDVMPKYLRRVFIRRSKRRLSEAVPLPSLAMLSTTAPKRKPNLTADAANSFQQQTTPRRRLSSSSGNHHAPEMIGSDDRKELDPTKLATISGGGLTDNTDADPDSLSLLSRIGSYRKCVEAGDFVATVDQSADGNSGSGGITCKSPWTLAADSSTVRIRMVNPSYAKPKKRPSRQLSSYRSQRGGPTGVSTSSKNCGGASLGAADQRGPVEPGGTLTPEQLESRLEWQELARAVDRLFFWLFMISSVALLAILGYIIFER